MPVISFVSPKGGCGKTTSAVILAGEIAAAGQAVVLIDADPNLPISKRWASLPGKPDNVEVIADIGDDTITDTIEAAAARAPFVIVDLEGTASQRVTFSVAGSDLVLVPAQPSILDADQAARAVKLVRQTAKGMRRDIQHAVFFSRMPAALRSRNFSHIEAQLQEAGVKVMGTQMIEREAFRSVFSLGGTIHTLDPAHVTNLKAARENARAFAAEIVGLLALKGS
jgi:chromosome partitioning protein